jgi:hypothetical protein
MRAAGFGFRVSGFEFRVSGWGWRISGLDLRVAGFGSLLHRHESWVLCLESWVLNPGHRVLGVESPALRPHHPGRSSGLRTHSIRHFCLTPLCDQAYNFELFAGVVKQVDALDSKSSGPCAHGSSILPSGTRKIRGLTGYPVDPFFLGNSATVTVFVTKTSFLSLR